jgi:ubiquinone/menaquinone biosynthesis C-methylase UbiE
MDKKSIVFTAKKVIVPLTHKGGLRDVIVGIFNCFFMLIGRNLFIDFSYIWNNKNGMEIGGPSHIFESGGLLPIYDSIHSIIFVDYNSITIWKMIREDILGKLKSKLRYEFVVSEASELRGINEDSLDFILASHVMEHLANPLKAVLRWKSLLHTGGYIILIVPDARFTFDHWRTITSIDHFLKDYKDNINEDDTTHIGEIINLHDQTMDNPDESRDEFIKRISNNKKNRSVHHHVFIPNNLHQLMLKAGLEEVYINNFLPFHIVGIYTKRREI